MARRLDNEDMKTLLFHSLLSLLFTSSLALASEPKIGAVAPPFKATTHDGKTFDLKSRKGSWTVLYFYPKAGTPGCTKQACAFRDSIDQIRSEGAEVYGISADTREAQAAFHKEHNLTFTLLADPQAKVIDQYGSKMENRDMSRRWTFIIGPNLKIRAVEKDVDPALNATQVAEKIRELKTKK